MNSLTKKLIFIGYFISVLFLGTILCVIPTPIQIKGSSKNITLSSDDFSFNKIKLSSVPYNNITVLSDGYNNKWNWNSGNSGCPSIAVDNSGNIHAVWHDDTNGKWGTDREIMYANWTAATGWSNASVISDGYNDKWGWNLGYSNNPSIAVDNSGNVHVVWDDDTDGKWGTDFEIMYANWTAATGWSNATVISDGYKNVWGWNDDTSSFPSIAAEDSGNIHVVWMDDTNNPAKWGIDREIMYVNWNAEMGWSNASVISDGYNNKYWNNEYSWSPSVAVDNSGNVHVVWDDDTNTKWGNDFEIMYANWTFAAGWSNATVISDGYNNKYWNIDSSRNPSIAVDNSGNVHVVWYDNTNGKWGNDLEIMYVNWTTATGWSNASVISDGYNNKYWNNGNSLYPSIAIDNSGNVYVVWEDDTYGKWGSDREIMYAKKTAATGWSNASVISDGYNDVWGWNNGSSQYSSIGLDSSGNVHIVWQDITNNTATWGTDWEIMYSKIQYYTPQPYYLLGGDDDDDDDDENGGIIYGYNIILLIAAILSVSAIYLKKKIKNINCNFISD